MRNPIQAPSAVPFELTSATLEGLGLKSADAAEVQAVAQRINATNPGTVAEFGREVAEHASHYSDALLEQVRSGDLNEAGDKLNQVVAIARTLNFGPLSDRRSRLPVIGVLIDRFRQRSANVAARFDSTRSQIEALIGEVDTTQGTILARNANLEDMFLAVMKEHRLLGLHIAAGLLRLDQLRAEADEARAAIGNDPAKVQAVADRDALIANLDKRVGDLKALQHSALQSLPTIRLIQGNNQLLVDKFHTIQTVTVPAWKRQFMLSLSLNEQRNAVQLATAIDDTTNDLLRKNAEMLYQNSVETAKANQRLVIDLDTLKEVQQNLIKTVQDVITIQQKGAADRQAAEQQLVTMRDDLRRRLARQPDGATLIGQAEGARA